MGLEKNAGRIYLLGNGERATALAWTDEPFPDSLNDWTYSEFLSPEVAEASGGHQHRLAFVNGNPCIVASTGYNLAPFGSDEWAFRLWVCLAETPTPSSTDDWTIIRHPRIFFQDEQEDFRYEITESPGGGLAIVARGDDDRLLLAYAADEAALRANDWQIDNIGAPSLGSGIPFELITHGQEMIVGFNPLNGNPGDLGLAVSGDPTGLVANWKMRRIPGITPKQDRSRSVIDDSSPMVMWGDRLVLLAQDAEGVSLARELTPGASTAAGWEIQRIAGPELAGGVPTQIFASLATSGLDCYVATSMLFGTENCPLLLMTAEGSW